MKFTLFQRNYKMKYQMQNEAEELKNRVEALYESGAMQTIANALFIMKMSLVNAGFTKEQAMQLLVAHGLSFIKKD